MKIYLATLLVIVGLNTQSQSLFTYTYQQKCDWNSLSELYTDCEEGRAQSVTFEIDRRETQILQKNQNISIKVAIKSREVDRKNGITIYFVINDQGETSYYILDKIKNELRMLSKSNGKSSLLIYSQSNPWQSN